MSKFVYLFFIFFYLHCWVSAVNVTNSVEECKNEQSQKLKEITKSADTVLATCLTQELEKTERGSVGETVDIIQDLLKLQNLLGDYKKVSRCVENNLLVVSQLALQVTSNYVKCILTPSPTTKT